jgi:CRP/FNR family cyclic AMP-dependent transcriptional regulator
MPAVEEVLSSVPLFSMLSKKDVAGLAKEARQRHFPAGSALTEQSDAGVSFTIIATGEATVSVGGTPVRKLGAGDFFGEMALIDRNARSATVTADTDVDCVMLSQWVFRPFAMAHPETAWALLELMVKRVRDAEERAAARPAGGGTGAPTTEPFS